LDPWRNHRNKLQSSPCGPTGIGINALLLSKTKILPMTASAIRVHHVSLFVPLFCLANFCFSLSLRRCPYH
jgi:hypothetical protein